MKLFLIKNKRKKILLLLVLYLVLCLFLSWQNLILKSVFYQKSWVHRVNSIEKMNIVSNSFNGVEIDIIYNKKENFFDVNHPPAKSINLSLEKLITSTKNKNKLNYWLDFKNLTKENINYSLNRLNSISNSFQINKKNIIVESKNPEFLKLFLENGYKTSYYLPSNLNTNKDVLKIAIQKSKNYKTTYLSSDIKQFKVISKFFPNEKIITWSYNLKHELYFNPIKIFKKIKSFIQKFNVLNNNKIDVVLFSSKTEGSR